MPSPSDPKRELLRHAVATLAYRCGKTLRGAPSAFPGFRASPTTRTPVEILAHAGDLFDWALSIGRGQERWRSSTPLAWEEEVARFLAAVQAFDDFLRSDEELAAPVEKLFQGPIADALTHTGQLALLRRMAGDPVRGENYFRAEITAGKVGLEQSPARREFD